MTSSKVIVPDSPIIIRVKGGQVVEISFPEAADLPPLEVRDYDVEGRAGDDVEHDSYGAFVATAY